MHQRMLLEPSTEVNADVDPRCCAGFRCAEPAPRAHRRPSQLRNDLTHDTSSHRGRTSPALRSGRTGRTQRN